MQESEVLNKILNEPISLSEEKRTAIISDSKHIRITAGAGAGKTETLTRRMAYLLLIKKAAPSSIVAFTFTDKAAQSMKSRVYQKLSELGMDDLVKHLSEMYIGTIHGYCLRVLQEQYGFSNYKVFDENQEMAFLMKNGFFIGIEKKGYPKNCENFLKTLNIYYDELLNKKDIERQAPEFFKLLVRYEELLDKHHRMTFSRIIYETVRRISNNPEKIEHISYLMVDEFQDINYAQFRLIEQIGKKASVFVVGDPRQSIYQFRGSNEQFFGDFEKYFKGSEKIEIKENWRSTGSIVNASNLFADTFKGITFKPLIAGRKEKGKISKLVFENDKQEAKWIADQIQELVEQGNSHFKDFALLFRSVGTSAEPFIDEFKSRSVPYIVGGKLGLFKRDEAQAVGRFFCWLSSDGFWTPNPYRFYEQERGDQLLGNALDYWNQARRGRAVVGVRDRVIRWKEKVVTEGYSDLKSVYHGLLNALDYKSLDIENPLDLAQMANLGRFSALLGDFEISNRLGGSRRNWMGELKGLCWFINSYASSSYGENPTEDLRFVDAVNIMTVHQSKGLEWPVVFLPSLQRSRFPSSRAGTENHWMIPDSLFDADRYRGGLENERRVFYVAITRAMDQMVVSYFQKGRGKDSASIFLKEIDLAVIDTPRTERMNHKTPERKVSEEIQTYAATEIISYSNCPHHYRLSSLWGYSQSLSPLIGYGEAVHHCLRHSVESIRAGKNPADAVQDSVDSNFYLPFASSDIADNSKKKARKMLVDFARKHDEDMRSIEEVETRVEFPTNNATVVGKVDVILRKDNTLEIRDYKTSSKVISDADSDMQLRLYTLGLRGLGKNIESGSIAYLEDCSIRMVSIKDIELKAAKDMADEIIENIQRGRYSPTPSDFCEICEYNDICIWVKPN